jgi:carbamoyl-phosphate synthase small subunit
LYRWNSVEDLKIALIMSDMKGLELASKVSTKEPYFGDENATYKIAALDLGIKIIFRNLAKEIVILRFFLMMHL